MEQDITALNSAAPAAKLDREDLFLLGYCFALSRGRGHSLSSLSELILALRERLRGEQLSVDSFKAIHNLLHHGKVESAQALLDINMHPRPAEVEKHAKKSAGESQDLFEEILRQNPPEGNDGAKRQRAHVFEAALEQSVAKRPKLEPIQPEPPNGSQPMVEEEKRKMSAKVDDEVATLELIKKLQEDDQKELEGRRKVQDAECKICMDRIDPNDYYPLDSCEHMFHPACIRQYIETQLNSRTFPIICPMSECKHEIDISCIKELLGEEKFAKFEKFTLKSMVEKNPEEYSCCPTPDCTYAFVWIAKEDSADFPCPQCKKHYCLNCRCPYHVGMSCKEYAVENKFTVCVTITFAARKTTRSSSRSSRDRSSSSVRVASSGSKRPSYFFPRTTAF